MEQRIYYDNQLARIHDRDFGRLAEKAAEVVLQMIGPAARPARIVDLGCGSGITAAVLSEKGHEVIGVDYSGPMIELARKNAPGAQFVQASLFDYVVPPCDVVTAIGEPFNYLFDNKSDLDRICDLFQDIYAALPPGGHFVFDLLAPGTLGAENPQKRLLETDSYAMFLHICEDVATNVLTREITIFYKQGESYQRSSEVHRQRLYDPVWTVQVLERLGFQVHRQGHYADYALRNGHHAFICRKDGGGQTALG